MLNFSHQQKESILRANYFLEPQIKCMNTARKNSLALVGRKNSDFTTFLYYWRNWQFPAHKWVNKIMHCRAACVRVFVGDWRCELPQKDPEGYGTITNHIYYIFIHITLHDFPKTEYKKHSPIFTHPLPSTIIIISIYCFLIPDPKTDPIPPKCPPKCPPSPRQRGRRGCRDHFHHVFGCLFHDLCRLRRRCRCPWR